MGGTPRGAGAESNREGAAETKCHGLTTAPIALSPAPLGGRMNGGEGGFSLLHFHILCVLVC